MANTKAKRRAKARKAKNKQKGAKMEALVDKPVAKEWPVARNQKDDLQQLSGIGLTTEHALNRIGILRFADFRGYSPESLAQSLQEKADLSILPRDIERHKWIERALKLAGESVRATAETEKKSDSGTEKPAPKDNEEKAKQTQSEVKTETSDPPKAKARSSEPEPAKTPPVESAPNVATRDVALPEQSGVKKEEPPASLNIDRFSLKPGNGDQEPSRIECDVSFSISGKPSLALVGKKLNFCAQLHAVNQTTGEATLLTSQPGRLQQQRLRYDVQFAAAIPAEGNYELYLVVLTFGETTLAAGRKGPRLRILA